MGHLAVYVHSRLLSTFATSRLIPLINGSRLANTISLRPFLIRRHRSQGRRLPIAYG